MTALLTLNSLLLVTIAFCQIVFISLKILFYVCMHVTIMFYFIFHFIVMMVILSEHILNSGLAFCSRFLQFSHWLFLPS